MATTRIDPEVYFAAEDKDNIGEILVDKATVYNFGFQDHTFFDTIYRSYLMYYGLDHKYRTGTRGLGKSGKRGELQRVKVNRYRSNIQHLVSLLTQQRPAFDCRAVNSDPESLIQAELGNRILDYVLRDKHFDKYRRQVVEHALVYGEGYLVLDWDVDAGDDAAVVSGEDQEDKIRKTGDITMSVYTPFDVVKDTTFDTDEQDWYIFTKLFNKYDVVEKYAKGRSKKQKVLKERILAASKVDELFDFKLDLYNFDDGTETDLIPVYEFRHKKSPSLPEGRLVKFLSDGSVLTDTPLPFKSINVFKMSPAHMFGTAYGYSPAFDVQGLQQGFDRLYSSVLTNNLTFGLQNILVDNNANLSQISLKGGMRFLRVNPEARVTPLQLTNSAPETYQLKDRISGDMGEGVGVNDALKGQVPQGVTSGTALSYLGSASLQYLSGLDNSKTSFEEELMTAIINMYKDFADTPRTATLVGRNKKSYLKDFKGSDLININRVVVDAGNPLTKTLAGRIQLAEQFVQMGMIKTPADFLQVIESGSLDPVLDGIQKENNLIVHENDNLMSGEPVIVTKVDDHIQHIREHRGLLSDNTVRFNPDLLGNVLDHIQAHLDEYRRINAEEPDLLQITQEAPLPPVPPSGQGPLGSPPNQQQVGQNPPFLTAQGQEIKQPRQPSQPKNPATGQAAQRSIPAGLDISGA